MLPFFTASLLMFVIHLLCLFGEICSISTPWCLITVRIFLKKKGGCLYLSSWSIQQNIIAKYLQKLALSTLDLAYAREIPPYGRPWPTQDRGLHGLVVPDPFLPQNKARMSVERQFLVPTARQYNQRYSDLL